MHLSERSGQVPGAKGDAGRRTRSSRSKRSVSSATNLQKEAQQRREVLFRKWEHFKALQREEKHTFLEEKVELQRELIQAYDDLFLIRRAKRDSKLQELRRSELLKKRETEEVLTQIGKDELGRDKEEQLTLRALERAAEKKRQKEQHHGEEETAPTHHGYTEGRGGAMAAARRNSFRRRLSSLSSQEELDPMMGELVFEQHDLTGRLEEEDDDAIQEEVAFEDLPAHKQKLYSLFGEDEAEYFLHPRIEPEHKKVSKVPHALRQLGGRVGADDLWDTLRDRSQHKLQHADARIPLELKDAYGAFVRECLTKNKTVAKRSFYSETEVPDGEKLQDSSYKARVKDTQRRMELMYRAAMANADKTGVLLYNNPIPDFNNREGHEGPLRYIPSWIPLDDEDEERPGEKGEMTGEDNYKKWLPSSSRMELRPLQFDDNVETYDIDMFQEANVQHGDDDSNEYDDEDDDQDFDDVEFGDDPRVLVLGGVSVSTQSLPDTALPEDDFLGYASQDPRRGMAGVGVEGSSGGGDSGAAMEGRQRGGEKKDKKRLVFLSERDAMCEGHFLENLAAKAKAETMTGQEVMQAATASQVTVPREGQSLSRRGVKKVRSHTAPATLAGSKSGSAKVASGPNSRGVSGSGDCAGTRMNDRRSGGTSKGHAWEPLTMGALSEHRPAVHLLGKAEFSQGREFMWRPILSTSMKGS